MPAIIRPPATLTGQRDSLSRFAILVPFVVAIALAACSSDGESESAGPVYWPTEEWQTAAPADQGFDEAMLQDVAADSASALPFLDALLIIRSGYIVHEQYFNGYDAQALHNIASVTKGWTSAAVGATRDREGAPSLDATLGTLLPKYFAGGQRAGKAEVTLRHLLQMRSGIEFSEEELDTGGYGSPADLATLDLTAWGLDLPIPRAPGESWNYSSLDTQLISAVMHEAFGQPLEQTVRETLFGPMGIRDYAWFADGAGTTIGGAELRLRPRDTAKLGLLYLHNGLWDGQQLVPAEWVESSLTPQGTPAYFVFSGEVEAIAWYGYHWWTWGPEWFQGYSGFQAKGFAGQQVLVLPELDLIVVTMANTDGTGHDEALEQEAAIYAFLMERVLPALTDANWEQP